MPSMPVVMIEPGSPAERHTLHVDVGLIYVKGVSFWHRPGLPPRVSDTD